MPIGGQSWVPVDSLNVGVARTIYAEGLVTGMSSVGGVASANVSGGMLQNLYWDVATTGQAVSTGFAGGILSNGVGAGPCRSPTRGLISQTSERSLPARPDLT